MTKFSTTKDCFTFLWQHFHLSTITIKDDEKEEAEEEDDDVVDTSENMPTMSLMVVQTMAPMKKRHHQCLSIRMFAGFTRSSHC
eukprot:12879512-Ditylum_brightwellii.AAC.1